jgi:hypothetical protein
VTAPPRRTAAERSDQTAARIAAAQSILADQLAQLRSGEDWKRYLALQSRLHRYSPNNATLIYVQHTRAFHTGLVPQPEPTCVAGYATWKALGRSVDRGQHGYVILAPVTVSGQIGRHQLAADDVPASTEPAGTNDGPQHRSRAIRGFKIEHVFDLSQTHGRPLPEPPAPQLLAGTAPPGLQESAIAVIESHGYRVERAASAAEIDGANGLTNWNQRQVVVRADMDNAAIVKTLLHEAAHIVLHEQPPGRGLPRQLKEVEAESVAYIVTSAHGMTSDDYSFPYIATWAGRDLESALRTTQTRVARAAKTLIDASSAAHHPGGRLPTPMVGPTIEPTAEPPLATPRLDI